MVPEFFLWNYEGMQELQANKDTIMDQAMEMLQDPEENVQWRV